MPYHKGVRAAVDGLKEPGPKTLSVMYSTEISATSPTRLNDVCLGGALEKGHRQSAMTSQLHYHRGTLAERLIQATGTVRTQVPPICLCPHYFVFGSDFGKLAKPSYKTVLKGVLGICNQSCPVLPPPPPVISPQCRDGSPPQGGGGGDCTTKLYHSITV